MEKLRVDLKEKSYDILMGENIFNEINNYINDYKKILIITNTTVGPLYLEKFLNSFKKKDNIFTFTIEDGEEYKKLDTVLPIYDFMLENNFNRKSLIISLGGGVVCDLSGYVAATFMRGIDFIQVPTTLLSQVDASIGGKVAVNYKAKNIIGSFYQPKLVLVDISVLKTLETREIKSGLGEIIKMAATFNKEFYDFIFKNYEKINNFDKDTFIKMIFHSCQTKAAVVSKDEKENGIRAALNYGHSYGHVIEKITNYKVYTHGEAVILGMNFVNKLGYELGLVEKEVVDKQIELFQKLNMSYLVPKYDFETMIKIFKKDKKNKSEKLRLVICPKLGTVKFIDLEIEKLKELYDKITDTKLRAIIDIGTNSVRLFIAELYNGYINKKYLKLMEITRLGEDVDKNGFLKDSAIERTIEVLKNYKYIIDKYKISDVKSCATSATRDSSNKNIFISRVKNEVGLNIKCISGEQEGIYCFNGILSEIKDNKKFIAIDIGGGSTEIIIGTKDNISFIKSFNFGSVRIKEKFFKNDKYKENIAKMKNFVYNMLDQTKLKYFNFDEYELVGVAGTVTTQVSVLKGLKEYDTKEIHNYLLNIKDIENNLELFMSKSIDERKKIVGLHPKRAEVIVAGTLILKILLKYFNKRVILVSENDILEGIMISK
ncbi:3-dehydroquinate synthase [Hypnocyclicus thermotrophus]|uniref:3-dehydroquinate synthase n=1 Tax=Hypnocyclicus thermotrophus TaxID=1627895 RepID=A0AA46I647_9FUSO|nr:3-dehydroquinate synthase [Hypnocyclicus thermotrophus]TDT72012.1 3-dehydroquinate synthase [Hypnocyclicus thermotrophus]